MIDMLEKIITSILKSVYESFGFALLVAILMMFLYLCVVSNGGGTEGIKRTIKLWFQRFRQDLSFRKFFLFTFYLAMILFRTLINREMWMNPISDIMGGWGLRDKDGNLTTEAIENMMLFVPFIILFYWTWKERILKKKKLMYILWKSMQTVFLCSFFIEFSQLILRLGTFQLSDLFYNTLGGFLGGLIYWIGYKLAHRKQ